MCDKYSYAGFWVRLFATVLDSIWMLGMLYLVQMYFEGSENIFEINSTYTITQFMFDYIIPGIIVIGFWIFASATPGKMLFNIKIVNVDTYGKVSTFKLVLRYLFYFLSAIPLCYGFLQIGWDKKNKVGTTKSQELLLFVDINFEHYRTTTIYFIGIF